MNMLFEYARQHVQYVVSSICVVIILYAIYRYNESRFGPQSVFRMVRRHRLNDGTEIFRVVFKGDTLRNRSNLYYAMNKRNLVFPNEAMLQKLIRDNFIVKGVDIISIEDDSCLLIDTTGREPVIRKMDLSTVNFSDRYIQFLVTPYQQYRKNSPTPHFSRATQGS